MALNEDQRAGGAGPTPARSPQQPRARWCCFQLAFGSEQKPERRPGRPMTRLVVRGSGSLAIRLKPPSDCPLLYVMPTRSTLRLSPAEQPTSISPTAVARTRRAASAMAGYSTAPRPASAVFVWRHGDGHDRVGHSQQRVDRRASGSVVVRSGIGFSRAAVPRVAAPAVPGRAETAHHSPFGRARTGSALSPLGPRSIGFRFWACDCEAGSQARQVIQVRLCITLRG